MARRMLESWPVPSDLNAFRGKSFAVGATKWTMPNTIVGRSVQLAPMIKSRDRRGKILGKYRISSTRACLGKVLVHRETVWLFKRPNTTRRNRAKFSLAWFEFLSSRLQQQA